MVSMCSGIRNRMSALFVMASLLLLQISLASISPHRLLATGFDNQGVKSYVAVMDINSDNAMITCENSRSRQRVLAAVVLDSICNTATGEIDLDILPATLGIEFDTWQTDVGLEFEAMPQSDMVSRK